jgi:hypothetical protein
MTLPKIDVPIYELKLPSSGKEIRVRPFLVKEEKLLLMAAESNDMNEIINVTKQVINNCMIDEKINIETLPFFDIDYLFVALRAKSISESVEINFTCNHVLPETGNKCGHMFDVEMDIANANVIMTDVPNVVEVGRGVTVKLKYPSYSVMKVIDEKVKLIDRKVNIIVSCIDQIIKNEKVFSSKDYSKDDLRDFVENLTEENFRKLEDYIKNFPYFAVVFDHQCRKCGFDHHIEFTDFESFFQ